MRYFTGGKVKGVIIASLTPGDLFLESVEEIIQKENIKNAVVTSGIGSFRKFNYHTITWTGMPPKDAYFSIEGPVEVGAIQGLIIDGEPHLHCTFNDCDKDKTTTGHIEHGCETCYLIELFIEVIENVDIKKEKDPENPGVVAFVPK
jgi:predicted DNA-binding protein with PD1-like motif